MKVNVIGAGLGGLTLDPAHFAMVEATTGGPREQTLKLSDVDGELTVTLRCGMIPPPPVWPARPVTLLGDAIHPAPGRGRLGLLDAIGAYEDTMRRNGFAKAST
ncbi:hypothetical protein [Amycolatopsis sp. CB00013]|uniref:hypothetical protein n=1 Tax=Amycolatopsis sp. CB00013 TaxID=1703945 RepID=UPI00093A026A|nr:hypothetical protein [Amycolatopsis sp. CB00013]OKK01737.1 hypothetical protein AMK34_09535 [Amycolatopsis sp. CB00013]